MFEFDTILSCPLCKESLKKDKYGKFVHCEKCGARYEIKHGIPDLTNPVNQDELDME